MKKNIKFFALAIFAVFSLFFVTATIAQTSTTGTVEGSVLDTAGAAVPNASITLSGPNLIRAHGAGPLRTRNQSFGTLHD